MLSIISHQSEQLVNFTNFSVFGYPRLELGKGFLLKIVEKKKKEGGKVISTKDIKESLSR